MAQLQQRQADNRQHNVWQNDGLNMAVNRQQDKFIAEPELSGEHIYIVQLKQPALSQRFSVPADPLKGAATLQAGSAGVNSKLFNRGQPLQPEVQQYRQQLLSQQQQVMAAAAQSIGVKTLRQQFTGALNGFSVQLTQAEAAKLAELPEVLSVQRSVLYQLHTDAGPAVIEADTVWQGNTAVNLPLQGEGVIVGIIDTGINTDHPSFAATAADGYQHSNPWGTGNYVGDCAKPGYASLCNDKLIGVRSYPVITDTYGWLYPPIGEDVSGHGSHVASTAAGNLLLDVDLVVAELSPASNGQVLAPGFFAQISGVAPRANIVSYQVCLPLEGCPTEALVAAIEDAITDGVDVINFSIGNVQNTRSPWQDVIEQAFLGAHQAGIAVAAAAGNAGGDEWVEYLGYIDHASPWLLNVAATTHGRSVSIETELTGFSGGDYPPAAPISGGGINDVALSGVVVSAANYGDAQCLAPFAAGTFAELPDTDGNPILDGQGNTAPVIVACERGSNARVEKAENVAAGGAGGFILYNATDYGDEGNIAYTDRYVVPGIHIKNADWWPLSSWLDSDAPQGHWLSISATAISKNVDVSKQDRLADFSSRGPSRTNPGLLVPSVSAPGVDIYAATNDESPFAESKGQTPVSGDFGFMSGTSMASPHVAGALALLSQAHPHWTVAQKQAALQLTAEPEVIRVRNEGQPWEERQEMSIYRAGSGRINVKDALNSGLLMDESHDNMLLADPGNGGLPHKLNIPQLVNFHCQPSCTWLRTFTATHDGSWSVSSDPVTNWSANASERYVQNGVTIKTVPEQFTLKAGESQTIMVTASLVNTIDAYGNSEVELQSHLILTEASNRSPAMRMPLVFQYDGGPLPDSLSFTMHSDQGEYRVNGIRLGNVTTPVTTVYPAVKPEIEYVELPTDDDQVMPWPASLYYEETPDNIIDEAVYTKWLDVPANSKRLVVEVLQNARSTAEYIRNANGVVYVGKDLNGDGIADVRTEVICASLHSLYHNYCYIENPQPGRYWAMVYNAFEYDMGAGIDTFKVAYAVVPDTAGNQLAAELQTTGSNGAASLLLSWDLADVAEDDVVYSGLAVGSSEHNPDSVGFVPLKLTRGGNYLQLNSSQTRALPGQTINLTFKGLPNLSGADRQFSINAMLPPELSVLDSQISVSNSSIVNSVSYQDGVLTISGEQQNTEHKPAAYLISTSDDDALCRMPDFGQNNPYYVDLLELGASPSFGGTTDDLVSGTQIPLNLLFGEADTFSLYNNPYALSKAMYIRGNGNITFDDMPYFFPAHYPFPYHGFPDQAIGTLWRGWGGASLVMDSMATPYNGWDEGITVASSTTGYAIVQWNGARSMRYMGADPDTWQSIYEETGDRFNFQLLFNKDVRFTQGDYELYMGYQSLNFDGDGRGSVGIQGYRGPRSSFGPLEGYLGSQFAYEDLDQKLKEGLVICMDYTGPESSQFEVTVPVQVSAQAAGKPVVITASGQLEGMQPIDLSLNLTVPGNITLAPIADKTIDENSTLHNLLVLYSHERNAASRISVSGEHISAVVHGHTPGSAVSITPAAHFFGTTEVTVTVTDLENPSDKASASFMLTVISDGEEPPPVSVTPPPAPAPAPAPKSSGGSSGIGLLTLLGLLLLSRRKLH